MWRIIFIILLFATTAYANPDSILDPRDSIQLNLPKYCDLEDRTDWRNTWDPNWRYGIPGVVQIKYIGLHDILFSQIRKRVISQSRSNLRRKLRTGTISESNFRKDMGNLDGDMSPQWHNRYWFYSLPPEKGGAPKEQCIKEIGWTLNIENLPIISWFYKQIKAMGDIWIENDHYYEGIEDGSDILKPDRSADLSNNDHDRLKVANPLPDVIVSRGKWYSDSAYHLRFKPSIKFRPVQGSNRIIDEINMKVLIELFWKKKDHFANFIFFTSHNIPDNDTAIIISFQLIKW